MKKWLLALGILVILLVGGYFVLTFFAVRLIQPPLQKAMGPGFMLEEVKVKPTYLSARGIQYEDPRSKERFFRVEEIRIYPSPLSLLKKSLHIRKLTVLRPSLFFYRSREGHLAGPWVTEKKEEGQKEISEKDEKKAGGAVEVQIDRVRIQKGSIDFEDRKTGDRPFHMKWKEVEAEIGDIRFPLSSFHSPVELDGKMEGKGQEGSIALKGWIDVKTMDMDTSLKIREIEVRTFEPYYRKRVTAEIESGTLDMDSRIALKDKRMDAPGELNLLNLRVKEDGGTVLWIPAETLADLLEKKGHHIKAKFHVKGDVESPQFNLPEAFLTQVALSLAQALGIPIHVIGEKAVESTLKGKKGLAEELRSIERLFKNKKEKKR